MKEYDWPTIIEVMVGAAILAILAALTVPALQAVRRKSTGRQAASAAPYQSEQPVEPEKRSNDNWWEREGK